jgi:central glycolytic genes regulator
MSQVVFMNLSDRKEFIEILKSVVPESIETLIDRYRILRLISYFGPIGRRTLSTKLEITERVARKEANVLKEKNLVDFTLEGMVTSQKGEECLLTLKEIIHDLKGISVIEEELARILKIKKVVLVESEDDELYRKELGRRASEELKKIIKSSSVLGLTGGSTVYNLVKEFKKGKGNYEDMIVIPARGGVGSQISYQANTLVEKLAGKLGAKYKILYTPDFLSKSSIETLKNEPSIKEILELVDNIDTLVFGIGKADVMASSRNINSERIDYMIGQGAVSEAFGYYFNEDGEVVYEISTIGIELEKFKSMKNIVAVAAGEDKADAIRSISKINENLILVTDKSTGMKILSKVND